MKYLIFILIHILFSSFLIDYVYQGQSEIKPSFISGTNDETNNNISYEGISGGFYRYYPYINTIYAGRFTEFENFSYNQEYSTLFAKFFIDKDNKLTFSFTGEALFGSGSFNGYSLEGLNIKNIDIVSNPFNIPIYINSGNLYFDFSDIYSEQNKNIIINILQ